MQTHTFIADSAESAVQQIRAELGPTAVVLSVRKLPKTGLSRLLKQEQIEVIARGANSAIEDPQPLAELREELRSLKQQVSAIHRRPSAPVFSSVPAANLSPSAQFLVETGLMPAFADEIAKLAQTGTRSSTDSLRALRQCLQSKWKGEALRTEAAVHFFVGVPGSGKTTVLCKMLSRTSLVERQPATVYQLDTHKANSASEPAIFAEIVGAQFERTLPVSFERREESVFVDLPGIALGDVRGLQQLRGVIESFGIPEIHLVLNAAYESPLLLEQVRYFSELPISDLVLTHVEEEFRWGKLWNLVLGTNYRISYLSPGQNVPGDLLTASADLLLDRQLCEK